MKLCNLFIRKKVKAINTVIRNIRSDLSKKSKILIWFLNIYYIFKSDKNLIKEMKTDLK